MLFSPPLLSPELVLNGLSEVPKGPWLSLSTPAPLPVVPMEARRRGSGLLCALPASESLPSPGSFPWVLDELSPILHNINLVKNNMNGIKKITNDLNVCEIKSHQRFCYLR